MSLFPAYSETPSGPSNSNKSEDTQKDVPNDWLTNSSFQTPISTEKVVTQISSDSSSDESVTVNVKHEETYKSYKIPETATNTSTSERRKSRHSKKRKKDKRKHVSNRNRIKTEYEKDVKDLYYEDKYRDKRINTMDTFSSRLRPFYDIGGKTLGFFSHKKAKKEVVQRYHTRNLDIIEKIKKKDTVIKRETTKDATDNPEEDLPSWCINLEEEERSKTKEYNEKLNDQPNNVDLWIEYIEFQDTLGSFHKYQLAKDVQRAIIMKKLSVVEKALEKNPGCTELLKLKLSFMGELSPADQFSNELEALVNKDSGNVLLWQTFIMITQGSVAMCTVPKVLELYAKCFCILRQRSRTNPCVFDEHLLKMLYQCLIFLRHTGLWEQMWETIRLNLSLNLSLNRDSLTFRGTIDEKKLIGMEEVILMSRLPLNQLWQRIESLRENCHWVSVSKDELELVGDSRRFVLPDDVADFVHPILSHNSNFRMAIYSLLSLKVPFLPSRNYMLKNLGLKELEWSVESSEVLLPFAYPVVGEMAGYKQRKELLNGILEGRLSSGPQYLKFHPAQEPYLDFIREIFRTIAENLRSSQRTNIYIWWLRFERLLIFLTKDDPLKHDNKGKKLKITLKDFLKKDENRNNLHFYREYALIEKEIGRFDNCVNILETAIQSQCTCPSLIPNLEERAALFSLYRSLIETLLDIRTYKDSHRQRILNIIEQMVSEKDGNRLSLVEEYLETCVKEFLEEVPAEEEKDIFFLPSLECDTIVCYAYFLYVKDCDINNVINILQRCIEHCKKCSRLQEMLYENAIAILQLHYEQTKELHHTLKDILTRTLNTYPDNFYALSVFATIESELPTWRFNTRSTRFLLWKAVSMCLAARRRIQYLTTLDYSDAANAALNKLISFHRVLARAPRTRCCPLLWRLYMLLLREHNLCEKKGEEVYHESVAQCPWARSVYIDAAEVAPQLLTQIQDVIREKELRMHVTPEELDILRG